MDASEVLGVSSSPLLTVDEATRVLLELTLTGRVVRLCDAEISGEAASVD